MRHLHALSGAQRTLWHFDAVVTPIQLLKWQGFRGNLFAMAS
ncbi:hypothetical protein EKH55_1656 [Sinorhizobium alkalisoli]|nr:hypothetical protein EKH55_1656 [Sinorhizobium alkalisoli]